MPLVSVPALLRESGRPVPRSRYGVDARGARPFFLAATAFAALAVPAWLFTLAGRTDPGSARQAVLWHGHELLYGYGSVMGVSYLIATLPRWTGREAASPAVQHLLLLLWLAGRAAMAARGAMPAAAIACTDIAFLPAALVALAPGLRHSATPSGHALLGILGLLAAANVVFHLGALGVVHGVQSRLLPVAMDLVTLFIATVAGRALPQIMRNVVGPKDIASAPSMDALAKGGLVFALAADAFAPKSRLLLPALEVAGVFAMVRALHWGARYSPGKPLLWVLHLGYAWVPAGLLLRAAALGIPGLPTAPAVHALSVGALGTLSLGMMARVSLGAAPQRESAPTSIRAAFVLVTVATVILVGGPLLLRDWTATGVEIAGLAWTAAFGCFFSGLLSLPGRANAEPE
jgi:uncharacterized protein involved in response to NO